MKTTRQMSDALIPLRNRAGLVIAEAIVDEEDLDRALAVGRWSCNVHRGSYVYRKAQGLEIKLHRFVLEVGRDDPMVDHRNRNPLDNRKRNLRLATNAQNSQNRVGRPGTSSVYRGVFWDAGVQKWRAQQNLNGKTIYIGIFEQEIDAAEAARVWRREYMPFADEQELYVYA